ncbi:uncharacterized protein Bfra_007866 [Botrytis fragariae]|uniref:Uncharacterized protein n=1 Tax=Botrytis fragariae TaxID=1964551 RepID=A0A8H6EGK1_9HELO|nr:uncharacterized protein Bfra_007866 [Botrytis fragariae]KAF5871351.1 hypothetical protein Bfra_007866 [Botrytis fragariae]
MSSNSNNTPLTALEARVLDLIDVHLRFLALAPPPPSPRAPRQQPTAPRPTDEYYYQTSHQQQHRRQRRNPAAQRPRVTQQPRVAQQPIVTQQSRVAQQPRVTRQLTARELADERWYREALRQHNEELENEAARQPTHDHPHDEADHHYLQQEWYMLLSPEEEALYQQFQQHLRILGLPNIDEEAEYEQFE